MQNIIPNGRCPILILILALAAPVSGFARNWVRIPITSVEGSAYFMDADSVARQGQFVRLWERLVLNVPSRDTTLEPFQSTLFLMSYDCGHKAAALLEAKFYSDAESRELIDHHIRSRPKYLYVAPDSPSAMKLDEACNLIKGHRRP